MVHDAAGKGTRGVWPTWGLAAIRAQGEGGELERRPESLLGVAETHGTQTRVTSTARETRRDWEAGEGLKHEAGQPDEGSSRMWVRGAPGRGRGGTDGRFFWRAIFKGRREM